jgi:hypothetical protein
MQEFTEEHGDFIPDYEVKVRYRPEMMQTILYIKMGSFKDGWRLFQTRDISSSRRDYVAVAPGEEPPMYLVLDEAETDAIINALRPQPEASARHLDDTIMVRDRLLVLVEKSLG